ncbi:MAG: DUF4856 domain-containing protein, partial [Bdellovibrionales bacterium]|nr:DUF4856 domain-containing protein [Bdellovibrionales bacterium]
MKFNLLTVILLFTTVSLSSSADANKIYNFPSQFDDQLNSVNYTGQVFRQLLIEELKKTMTGIQRGSYQNSQDEISESLWSYIDYNHENDSFAILAVNGEVEFELIARDLSGKKMSWTEGYVFNDIATGKQLLDKLAGNDNPLYHGKLLGWKSENIQTPQELLNYLIEKLAKNSAQADVLNIVHPSGVTELVSAAKVTDEGQDLAELIQKLLHGAISFSQIARDYLSTDLGTNKGLNAENFKKASDNKFYTHLEHHWDEAFGYFGASRNYLNYNDLQIKEGLSIDTVNWGQSKPDGSISMNTEKNFGLSVLAAKRDLGADTDFTSDIYNDFYKGRKLITEKPEGYLVEVIKLSQNIILNIEKVIAASVIH